VDKHESTRVEIEFGELVELKQEISSLYFREQTLLTGKDGEQAAFLVEESTVSIKREINSRYFTVPKGPSPAKVRTYGIGSAILITCGVAGMIPDVVATLTIIDQLPPWIPVSLVAAGLAAFRSWWQLRKP